MKLDIKKTYELFKELIDNLDGNFHTITCEQNGEIYAWKATPRIVDSDEWCADSLDAYTYVHIATLYAVCDNWRECIYQFRDPVITYQVPADHLCNMKEFINSLPKQFLDVIDITSIDKAIKESYGFEYINNTPSKTGLQYEPYGYIMHFRWKTKKNSTKLDKCVFKFGAKYRISVAKQTITID